MCTVRVTCEKCTSFGFLLYSLFGKRNKMENVIFSQMNVNNGTPSNRILHSIFKYIATFIAMEKLYITIFYCNQIQLLIKLINVLATKDSILLMQELDGNEPKQFERLLRQNKMNRRKKIWPTMVIS